MTHYLVFGAVASYLFAMDLLLNRGKEMTLARATSWSIMYVIMAFVFAGWLWFERGPEDAQLFIVAYALEKVLSVDNLVVFSAVFMYFDIRHQNRHRILRWGIIGAAILRLVFVYVGTSLFDFAERVMSVIFAILIFMAAYAILFQGEQKPVDHNSRWYSRLLRRWFPVVCTDTPPPLASSSAPGIEGKFLVRCFHVRAVGDPWGGKWVLDRPYWAITPALLCLVAIEMTDIMFAVDSVPVVVAVARDPFIVYSSMIFAIMGLRALYFVLDALQTILIYMNFAIAVVLGYVAFKLIAGIFGVHIPPFMSLGIVLIILTSGVVASLLSRKRGVFR